MTTQAAISLAVDTRVLAGDASDPACFAAHRVEIGDPDSIDVLERFGRGCDVVTFDHERVAPDLVAELETAGHTVRPGSATLRFADKAYQRQRLSEAGFPVPEFTIATTTAQIEAFARRRGWPVVAKSASGGYDGRGVFILDGAGAAQAVVDDLGDGVLVVEPLLEIEREIAVVIVRRPGGETVTYPVIETVQRDGICVETLTPATIDTATGTAATELACDIAHTVGAVGILAVELFVTPAGLVLNELAPRPHNSGHWTIEGAATSQFANHIRSILDWPLGETELTAPAVAMVNVLGNAVHGDPIDRLPAALEVKGASVHLYAKAMRDGRKLGHVTALGPDPATALTRARRAAEMLGSPTPAAISPTTDGARP